MANLSRDDVLKLARLARLQLTEEEIPKYQKEISAILEYVEQLQQADVDTLEPTYQVTGLKNVGRTDEVLDYGVDHTALFQNAPQMAGKHLKVKRILQ